MLYILYENTSSNEGFSIEVVRGVYTDEDKALRDKITLTMNENKSFGIRSFEKNKYTNGDILILD